MCELFGSSGKDIVDVSDFLKVFYSHSKEHPHGWGLARWDANNKPCIIKSSRKASDDKSLSNILCSEIKAKTVLAHIRFATIGNISKHNSHPFWGTDKSGRQWTFIHNGTIFSGVELIKYEYRQNGSTDSERVFLYLLDKINENIIKNKRKLSIMERTKIIEDSIKKIANRNKLNLIIYDEEVMYVHTNMKNTLYTVKKNDRRYFSTTPLTQNDNWENVPMMRLFAYKDGKKIYTGTKHNCEYIMCKPGEIVDYVL